jgi:HSP20 family protein
MAETEGKTPTKTGSETGVRSSRSDMLQPFDSLRREVDRLFDEFGSGFFRMPFGRGLFDLESFWSRGGMRSSAPAVDIVERDKAYEMSVELPGTDEKDIELKLANDMLTIRGERKDEREEQKRDYRLSERHYGVFERSFRLPEDIDTDKIEAKFEKGILTVTLPKTPEAQSAAEKKIPIKTG